jgi:hypothetical protein
MIIGNATTRALARAAIAAAFWNARLPVVEFAGSIDGSSLCHDKHDADQNGLQTPHDGRLIHPMACVNV